MKFEKPQAHPASIVAVGSRNWLQFLKIDCTRAALVQRTLEFFRPACASYSMTTRSVAPRPNTSGEYISSALGGLAVKVPGVVARAV